MGCGPGNMAIYLLSKNKTYNIHGIDLSPNMIDIARKAVPSSTFAVQDAKEFTKFLTPFHGILASFILPYLSFEDVDGCLSNIHNLLLPGGVF